jgi:hypothetical protein
MDFWLAKKNQLNTSNTSPKNRQLTRGVYGKGRMNRRTSSELPFNYDSEQIECFHTHTHKNIIEQILKLRHEFGSENQDYLNYM